MNYAETTQSDPLVAHYLQSMQALRSEMATAMDCIARNALAPLQESIARQEALCSELAEAAKKLKGRVLSPKGSWKPDVDPAAVSQVREADASLRKANLEYAALLRHSGKTLALLASLNSTFTGNAQEARGPRSKHQTWSCEM